MTGYQSKKDMAQDKLAQPAQEPVANDRALQLVTHQLNHLVAYATELRERLNKYEGGAPMLLNITPPQRTVQVSPLEFVEMVMDKEHLVGNPIVWAQWPNKEKNT
jgi:hypothetical protein